MRSYILLLFSCIYQLSFGQNFSGKIFASDTKLPIQSASIYLSNTSVGTTSNVNGEFTIPNFPSGRFDLIVSCLGYEPYQTTVVSSKLEDVIIYLIPRAKELQEVIVQSYEKDGWTKWGKTFLECFIGNSALAPTCIIKNKEVVKFRYDRKENTLYAFANETLVIENEMLGYNIKYDMVKFEYDLTTRLLFFGGFPLFTQMETKRKGKITRWEEQRSEVYYGSMMHFMRALYRNRISEEEFEVRKLLKQPNLEKQRVTAIMKQRMKGAKQGANGLITYVETDSTTSNIYRADSTVYYNRMMREPDEQTIVMNELLPGDSIAYAKDSVTATLDFTDRLQIIYRKKAEPIEFAREYMQAKPNDFIQSVIYLIHQLPIFVTANGMHYQGTDLLSSGFWGWSEKMGNALPFDYKPPPQKKE